MPDTRCWMLEARSLQEARCQMRDASSEMLRKLDARQEKELEGKSEKFENRDGRKQAARSQLPKVLTINWKIRPFRML